MEPQRQNPGGNRCTTITMSTPGFHSVKAHNGVKMGHYKLIHFYKDNVWEMYDLKADPTEMNNVYGLAEYNDIQLELHAELEKLIHQYQVPQKYLQ